MTQTELIQSSVQGDKQALETLLRSVQPLIFNYALRMLSNREDAEDATQEIMLRIVTHLAGFRFESEFSTWCYSIATNCLLTSRKRRSERHHLSFEEFGLDLGQDLAEVEHHLETLENRLLAEEVKITCTQAMLLCLSREERAAYILGEILGMTDTEAALVCSVQPAAFRKRLSRAREQVRSFTIAHCGWVNPQNPCRCGKRIAAAVRGGRINPDSLEFARRGDQPARLEEKRQGRQAARRLPRRRRLDLTSPGSSPRPRPGSRRAPRSDPGRLTSAPRTNDRRPPPTGCRSVAAVPHPRLLR